MFALANPPRFTLPLDAGTELSARSHFQHGADGHRLVFADDLIAELV